MGIPEDAYGVFSNHLPGSELLKFAAGAIYKDKVIRFWQHKFFGKVYAAAGGGEPMMKHSIIDIAKKDSSTD